MVELKLNKISFFFVLAVLHLQH